MKKLLIIGLSAFLLAACSFTKTTTEEIRNLPSEETGSKEDASNEEEIQEEEANKVNADTDKTGVFAEEGIGKLKTVGVGYNEATHFPITYTSTKNTRTKINLPWLNYTIMI